MLKTAYTLLLVGAALFLYQLGEIVSAHSTWSELVSPAAFGEILKLAGSVIGMVLGAAGIPLSKLNALKAKNRDSVKLPRPTFPPAA